MKQRTRRSRYVYVFDRRVRIIYKLRATAFQAADADDARDVGSARALPPNPKTLFQAQLQVCSVLFS